jgi:ubiquinone/menaquinone biosynthesis C-methylase UbiE
MTKSVELNRDNIYRDSKKLYSEICENRILSRDIVDFCRRYAGKKILDFGCATGDYCLELKRLGFKCIGVDINEDYVKIARDKGVEAYFVKDKLPFDDKSFDTVIMIEVLEHVSNPAEILQEIKRVTRKNVCLTVPNNTQFYKLKQFNLTYEHMLEGDHVNFFTKESLSNLLSKHYNKYYVKEEEPIYAHGLLPWYIRKPISLAIRVGLIKPLVYFRLYAECSI